MNCCYNCQRRHAGCHGQCADYAEYRAQLETNKARATKQRKDNHMIQSYCIDSMRRKGVI